MSPGTVGRASKQTNNKTNEQFNLQGYLVVCVLELKVQRVSDISPMGNFLLCDVSNPFPLTHSWTVPTHRVILKQEVINGQAVVLGDLPAELVAVGRVQLHHLPSLTDLPKLVSVQNW